MAAERKFVRENMKRVLIKEFLMSRAQDAGFGGVSIQRTPLGTRVTLTVERPGMVIGRHGGLIKQLTEVLERDFGLDNPQVEVQEARNANLNAQIMAQKLAFALERGWHFRRGGHSTVRRIMESGAKGCQVTIAGKLTGERHRREKFKQGHIKFCGEPALQWMHHGYATAKKKSGIIGVTIRIMDPDAVLPDEIKIHVPEGIEVPPQPEPAVKATGTEPADADLYPAPGPEGVDAVGTTERSAKETLEGVSEGPAGPLLPDDADVAAPAGKAPGDTPADEGEDDVPDSTGRKENEPEEGDVSTTEESDVPTEGE